MLKCWSRSVLIASLRFSHVEPIVFISSQWQSTSTPNIYYLMYRICITLYVFIIWLLTIIDEQHIGKPFSFYIKWTVYLTNWGLTMILVQAVLGTIMLCNAFAISRRREWSDECVIEAIVSRVYKVYWITFTMALDMGVSVTILYWTLVYTGTTKIDYVNIVAHVTNSVVMLVELCMVAHTVRFMHFYVSVCFGTAYGLFNLFYFLVGGTSRMDDPYVYSALDWRRPGPSILTLMGACVLLFIVHALTFGAKRFLLFLSSKLVRTPTEDAPVRRSLNAILAKYWNRSTLIGSLRFKHNTPIVFVSSMWQPNSRPNIYYFMYRICITLYTLIIWVLTIVDEPHPGKPHIFYVKWMVYLTNWGLTMILLQAVIATLMVGNAFAISRRREWSDECVNAAIVSKLYRIYWIIFTIALDIAFTITVLYWTLVYRAKTKIDYVNVVAHVTNSVIMLVELCVVAHNVRFMHVYVSMSFATAYGLFSLFYFLVGGTSRWDDPYMYSALDWRHPGRTMVMLLGVVCLIFLVHALTFSLKKLLLFLGGKIGRRHEDTPAGEEFTPAEEEFTPAEEEFTDMANDGAVATSSDWRQQLTTQ